jgi:hypothetical protein
MKLLFTCFFIAPSFFLQCLSNNKIVIGTTDEATENNLNKDVEQVFMSPKLHRARFDRMLFFGGLYSFQVVPTG